MASVFSIENISLNGDMLTASNGSLYINDVLVQNTSGIQLSERFFIKGYAPISFYSRWPQQGYYLNETYLNDFFMATGLLVTCTHPTTGEQIFYGGLYERPATSAIDTTIFANFELQQKQIIQHTSLNYKINRNKIIGLNVYNAPEDMRSISVHLLGYFPAAAHFDKMPKQINFYAKNIPLFSENLHEEYSQWDSTYSGFGIYCSHTGAGNLTYPKNATGYISGFLEESPVYGLMSEVLKPSCNPCDPKINTSGWSGYYLDANIKNNFPSEYFSGFSGQEGFSSESGFEFSGFSAQKEIINYISYDNQKYGSGEILQTIGWRSGSFPEKISGFLSGYLNQYGGFVRLSKITTGVSGSGIFFGQDYDPYRNLDTGIYRLDLSGFAIGSSGYFINDKKYFFPSNRPMLYNIVGFISGFMNSLDQFSPGSSSGYFINTPSDYIKIFFPNVGFDEFINMYGIYTGSGYSSYYTGFSFPLGSGFSGLNGAINNTDGIMTGVIGAANVFIPFSGFSGRPDIDLGLGFEYSGMHYDIFEDFFSGLSFDGAGYTGQWIGGIGKRNISGRQEITGFAKVASLYNFKLLNINESGISGYYYDNILYKFKTGVFDPIYNKFPEFNENPYAKYGYSYSGFFPFNSGFSGVGLSGIKQEYIVGFISGYKDILGDFYEFDPSIASSGFITGNKKYFFPKNNLFSGFSGFDGFDTGIGFLYTGMGSFPYRNNNFIGDSFPNSGSGIITGYIGWRNVEFFTKEYGTGIVTGIIGYINFPHSGVLTGNFYHKNKFGTKVIGPSFGLNIGQYYQESFGFGFAAPWGSRVGIDVYNPLSGISDINIALFGYYE